MYMWASANSLPLQNIIVGQCVYVKLQCDLNLKGAMCEIYSEFFFFFQKEGSTNCTQACVGVTQSPSTNLWSLL